MKIIFLLATLFVVTHSTKEEKDVYRDQDFFDEQIQIGYSRYASQLGDQLTKITEQVKAIEINKTQLHEHAKDVILGEIEKLAALIKQGFDFVDKYIKAGEHGDKMKVQTTIKFETTFTEFQILEQNIQQLAERAKQIKN